MKRYRITEAQLQELLGKIQLNEQELAEFGPSNLPPNVSNNAAVEPDYTLSSVTAGQDELIFDFTEEGQIKRIFRGKVSFDEVGAAGLDPNQILADYQATHADPPVELVNMALEDAEMVDDGYPDGDDAQPLSRY